MQSIGFTPLAAPALHSAHPREGARTTVPAPAPRTQETCGDTPCGDSTATVRQPTELSEAEQKQLRQLQSRDREVRAHEAAHKGAAGQYATGAASFSYQRGPDGRLYAIGGEVGIDTSPIADDPEATLQKANQVRAAALAPAQPSGQDMAVAAEAALMAASARSEMMDKRQEEAQPQTDGADASPPRQRSAGVQQYQSIAREAGSQRHTAIDLTA